MRVLGAWEGRVGVRMRRTFRCLKCLGREGEMDEGG